MGEEKRVPWAEGPEAGSSCVAIISINLNKEIWISNIQPKMLHYYEDIFSTQENMTFSLEVFYSDL